MPSTFSSRFGLERPATGELQGLWGGTVNTSITDLLDETLDAVRGLAILDADVTLTIPNATSSPNRAGTIHATGTLTAIRTITLPAGDRVARVANATAGGFNVGVKGPTTGTVEVRPGTIATILVIGSSIYMISPQIDGPMTIQGSSASPILTINQAGAGLGLSMNAGITLSAGQVTLPAGTDAAPALALPGNAGLYQPAADQVSVATGGVERVNFRNAEARFLTPLYSTGDITINNTSPELFLDAVAAGQTRVVRGRTGTSQRWAMVLGNLAAESGGNAGSNFALQAYDDSGTILSTPIGITRSSGIVDFAVPPRTTVNPSNNSDLVRLAYLNSILKWEVIFDHTPITGAFQEFLWAMNAFRACRITMAGLRPVSGGASVDLFMQVRRSGSFLVGGGDYFTQIISSAGAAVASNGFSGGGFLLTTEGTAAALDELSGRIDLDCGGAGLEPGVVGQLRHSGTISGRRYESFVGSVPATGGIDGIRFFWGATPNWAAIGRIIIEGFRN
jgi:hypothetical protein